VARTVVRGTAQSPDHVRSLREGTARDLAANHPSHERKRRHSFVGPEVRAAAAHILQRSRTGSTFTITAPAKRACGDTYVREEDLALLFGELVKRVRIPGGQCCEGTSRESGRQGDHCANYHDASPTANSCRSGQSSIAPTMIAERPHLGRAMEQHVCGPRGRTSTRSRRDGAP
jgi:hypothetical protein